MSAPRRWPDSEGERQRLAGFAAMRSLTPWILSVCAAAFLLHLLQNVLLPFVIAALVGYLCTPLVDALARRTRLPRWSVASGLFAVLMAGGALLGFLGVSALVRESQSVRPDLHSAVSDFVQALLGTHSVRLLGTALDPQRLTALIVDAVQRETTGARLVSLLGWAAAAAFCFIQVWVLIGYLLVDSRRVARGLMWLVPPQSRARSEQIWHELDPLLRRYFLGMAAVVAYAAATAYLGLGLVLRLHHALLLALLTGVLEVIPMVGPVTAAVIAGLVAVHQAAHGWDIWAYVVYATVLRLSTDQVVGPLVLGRAARVHPVVVIFSILAGAALFGIVGMILAVPIALLVKVSLSVLYREAQ
jgi:predicted PurR-regulated permease PerM